MTLVDYTFFSLFFSAVSSLPAFAAWRLSCFAVNCGGSVTGWGVGVGRWRHHFQVE